MLSRRGFFGVAAGAAAVAAGGAAVAAPAAFTGIDRAVGADRTVFAITDPMHTHSYTMYDWDWANDAVSPTSINAASRALMAQRMERLREIYKDFLPNDLTREQLAANLPVIGKDKLPAEKPADKALLRECSKPVPAKESFKAYLKRMSLPCPGRLE